MAGLGRRILGATLVGAGTGIVTRAKQRREDTLLHLQRKWQQDDASRQAAAAETRREEERARREEALAREDARRAEDRDFDREMQGRREALTREGWDRREGSATEPESKGPRIMKVRDEYGGEQVVQIHPDGTMTPVRMRGEPGAMDGGMVQAGASAEDAGPGFWSGIFGSGMQNPANAAGTDQGAMIPPVDYPDAQRAPDGHWYVQREGQTYRVEK